MDREVGPLCMLTQTKRKFGFEILPTRSVARTDWLVCETAPSGGLWHK